MLHIRHTYRHSGGRHGGGLTTSAAATTGPSAPGTTAGSHRIASRSYGAATVRRGADSRRRDHTNRPQPTPTGTTMTRIHNHTIPTVMTPIQRATRLTLVASRGR